MTPVKHYFVECRDGFYNVTCNQQCGNCNDGKSCDKINGICLNGCSPQFQPPLCKGILFVEKNNQFYVLYFQTINFLKINFIFRVLMFGIAN